MTAPENSTSEELRKLLLMRTIARWGLGLTATLWITVQVFAYVQFGDVPWVGWEFLLLALGFAVFTAEKYTKRRREIQRAEAQEHRVKPSEGDIA